jgi:pyrimidine-nucleoside phosphorylase
LGVDELLAMARKYGIALAGQSADLAPADGKLYALRDVTATVPSLPLIASSIMSKKIAGGANAIVLDVKVGHGAFMETLDDARTLSHLMISIGEGAGRRVTAVLSDMSQPLGRAVGNALEVVEAVETLRGGGPTDLVEHCLVIGSEMLTLGGLTGTPEEGRAKLVRTLGDGSALEKFRTWVRAQGGDVRAVDDVRLLPQAPVVEVVATPDTAYVASIDAREVGLTSVELGAGRQRKGEAIDPAVGIVLGPKVGEGARKGEPLFTIHARDKEAASVARERLLAAYTFSSVPVPAPPLIYGVLRNTAG